MRVGSLEIRLIVGLIGILVFLIGIVAFFDLTYKLSMLNFTTWVNGYPSIALPTIIGFVLIGVALSLISVSIEFWDYPAKKTN